MVPAPPSLPSELWERVFCRLGLKDWARAASTCHALHNVQPRMIAAGPLTRHEVEFLVRRWGKAVALDLNLEGIELEDDEIMAALVQGTSALRGLKKLEMSGMAYDNIAGFNTWLMCVLCNASETLRYLHVVTNASIVLPHLAALKHLSLLCAAGFPASQTRHLSRLGNLQTLLLAGDDVRLTVEAGVLELQGMHSLQHVVFFSVRPTLLSLPGACSLVMQGSLTCFSGLKEENYRKLIQVNLHLDEGPTCPASLLQVLQQSAPDLRVLELQFAGAAALEPAALCGLQALEDLGIISRRDLSLHLPELPRLKHLRLQCGAMLHLKLASARSLLQRLSGFYIRYLTMKGPSLHELTRCWVLNGSTYRTEVDDKECTVVNTAGVSARVKCVCAACYTCLVGNGVAIGVGSEFD
jgi:hypothetical protein